MWASGKLTCTRARVPMLGLMEKVISEHSRKILCMDTEYFLSEKMCFFKGTGNLTSNTALEKL